MNEIVWQQNDSHTNHRRGRRLPNGEVTVEHSDDGKIWHPAQNEEATSAAGHAKREALSQGAVRQQHRAANERVIASQPSQQLLPTQVYPIWKLAALALGSAAASAGMMIATHLMHWW